MLRLASAYIVTESLLLSLEELARSNDTSLLLETLRREAFPEVPEYAYSGSVLSVVIDYAEEQGLLMPLNQGHPGAESVMAGCPRTTADFPKGRAGRPSPGC